MALKICVDAGHGGRDCGAIGGVYEEADATLAIAKKVAAKLKAKGCKVKLTRDCDEKVLLSERCEISNKFKADAFVSIHLNAAANKDAHGIETWRYDRVGSRTLKLAHKVQTELIAATGARDRGVKTTQSFYVLKHTVASAILVECGFISNNKECEKLFTDAYQNKIAEAIARGVVLALQ